MSGLVSLHADMSGTLPVFPILEKGRNDSTLTLTWENPQSTYIDVDDVYFNYTVTVNITAAGGHYYNTLSYKLDVESHEKPNTLVYLSECQLVDISISLPGNCEDKKISGSLPIGLHISTTSVIYSYCYFPIDSSSTVSAQCH